MLQLAENISQLIEHQRTLTFAPPASPSSLVYQVALANFDRMLQQLPPPIVEDVCFEITALIYDRIKRHRGESQNVGVDKD